MKVMKAGLTVIRTVDSKVKVSEQRIRKIENNLERSLSSSVIGADEGEQEGTEADLRRQMSADEWRKFQKLSKRKKTHYLKKGTKNTISSGSTANGSVSGGTAAGKTATRGAAAGKAAAGKAAAGKAAAGKAAAGVAAAGKAAAGKAAAVGVTAASGAATAGVTVAVAAVVSAAAAIKRTAKRAARRVRTAMEAETIGAQKEQNAKAVAVRQSKQEEKNGKGSTAVKVMAGFPGLVIVMILMGVASILSSLFFFNWQKNKEKDLTRRIVAVAEQEAADAENNIGGTKYKEWYGLSDNWCVIFISWCADQCEYIEQGVMPKEAGVSAMKKWYEDRGRYHPKEGYEPKAGDIIFFGNGSSHAGIVTGYDESACVITTVEGNTGMSETDPYHEGSRVKEHKYVLTYESIIGYATPEYTESIEIPEPYGTAYTYMGWQTITSVTSRQYKLREEAGMNFDENGFGKINDRYVIACTTMFGSVGDFVDWELESGAVIQTVIGDIKNQNDEGCNKWGHNNGACVVEFVVDKATWYGTSRTPILFHPEWKSRVVKATSTGSFWQ